MLPRHVGCGDGIFSLGNVVTGCYFTSLDLQRVATLKVGDIEIDGGHVRIGPSGAHVTHGSPFLTPSPTYYRGQISRPAPLPQANYTLLKAIPLAPGFIVIAGCIVSALGIIGTVVGRPLGNPIDIFLHGTFLIPIGVGLALVGILKAIHQDSLGQIDAANADEVTEEWIAELGEVLRDEDRSHTVEWIQNKLGWNQADVVRTLAWLRERGELREEIDVDTEHYYYVASPRPRDLDARLRATHPMQ